LVIAAEELQHQLCLQKDVLIKVSIDQSIILHPSSIIASLAFL
jgi:hypothetical protein